MSRLVVVLVAIVLLNAVGETLAIPATTKQIALEAEPCDDFYTYVCGVRELTKDRITPAIPSEAEALDLFENYPSIVGDDRITGAETKMYEWKEQCSKLEVGNRKEFIQRFNFPNSIGGWPAFEKNWRGRKFNLQNAIAELGSYSIPVIIDLMMDPDPKTFGARILITVVHTTNLLEKESRELMKIKLSSIIENIDEVLDDSAVVSNWSITAAHDRYLDPLQTDFKGLKTAIPEINWDKQVEAVFDHQIPEDFPVTVAEFEAVKYVLSQAFQADPKIIANYMLYRFATALSEINKDTWRILFRNVLLPILVKQSYIYLVSRYEPRDMLYAILKNLHTSELLFNNDSPIKFEWRIDSFLNDTVPTVDYAYYDNAYAEFEVSPSDCYSDVMELRQIFVKLHNEKMWKYGPLRPFHVAAVDSFMNELPAVSNSSSAEKFRNLAWAPVRSFIRSLGNGLYNHKTLKDCEKHTLEEFDAKDYMDYLGVPLLVRSYFDFAKTNPELSKVETARYGMSSESSLMVQLMLSYCDKYIEKSVSKKLSWYFANLKMFQDTFNCQSEVTFTLENKCFNNATQMY